MALFTDRTTPEHGGQSFGYPVAAGAVIYQGALVALNASGFVVPGSTATGLQAIGKALARVDNSTGADGDLLITFKRGVYSWDNHGTDTITRAHVGGSAYIVDDHTVAATDGTGTRSVAGTIMDITDNGVFVETR
ncbi:hypothetical protein [Magnetococcus sp. PR-3]|uniref:hypothetical protein n=1 Tax=Magnetococcus sp. PR-3 TaxID=3120355 RepID=UPI002FCDEEC6